MDPRPRIVFLDASTLDCGAFDFSPLEALGDVTLYPITAPEDVIDRCGGADIVLTNKVVLDRSTLTACPDLRYVVITATGTNNVDLAAAEELGIPVDNVVGYSTPSVAQHVFASVLVLATNIHRYAAEAELWPGSPIFTRLDYPVAELEGRRLGIVGLGAIGRRVAEIGAAFGMDVVALARDGATASGEIARLPSDEFFSTSDIVTLHCPLTPETEGMIDTDVLAQMKPSAFLINTGRGQLIDEPALISALRGGRIGGAALDVLTVEPPPADHPLLAAAHDLPNLLITPHTAWATLESRRRLLAAAITHIQTFLASPAA